MAYTVMAFKGMDCTVMAYAMRPKQLWSLVARSDRGACLGIVLRHVVRFPHLVVAYIIIACTFMAHTSIAYIGMAYIVIAHVGTRTSIPSARRGVYSHGLHNYGPYKYCAYRYGLHPQRPIHFWIWENPKIRPPPFSPSKSWIWTARIDENKRIPSTCVVLRIFTDELIFSHTRGRCGYSKLQRRP